MKWIIPCAVLLASLQAEELATPEQFNPASVLFASAQQLDIHLAVAGLDISDMLVFTESEVARLHVRKGFALVHASWDFEAYQHFSAALREDPECLMAYCGVVLSMSNPVHEFSEERARAFNQMLSLAEFQVEGEFYYPEVERLYAIAIAELMVNGVEKGARVFSHIAETYPGDIQAQLLSAYLSRGGYNELGNPRTSQREALEKVANLLKQAPENQMVRNFLLILQAEAPQQAVDFKAELLPEAQKLVASSESSVAPWLALQGHIAWRAGEMKLAEESFRKAVALYLDWRESNKVDYADCEGLIRAELYLAAVLHEQGKIREASDLVSKVNTYRVAAGREISQGALTLKWSAALMPAKFHLEAGDYQQAKLSLPSLEKQKAPDIYTAVITAYQLYIDACIEQEKGKQNAAKKRQVAFTAQLKKLQQQQEQTGKNPEFSEFMRALETLAILQKEVTAQTADTPELASSWYRAAVDAQSPGSRLLPPDILYPVEYKLGLYYERIGETEKAKQAFAAALKSRPSYQKAAQQL